MRPIASRRTAAVRCGIRAAATGIVLHVAFTSLRGRPVSAKQVLNISAGLTDYLGMANDSIHLRSLRSDSGGATTRAVRPILIERGRSGGVGWRFAHVAAL